MTVSRDREIGRLLELPKARCVLALDGKSDIFRAKEILDGHMCLLGDVHPRMLAIGDPQEVACGARSAAAAAPGAFAAWAPRRRASRPETVTCGT